MSQYVTEPTWPNLTEYLLPAADDGKYSKEELEAVLALMLLTDQGPIALLRGMNGRYAVGFFAPIAERFVKDLILSDRLPDSIECWMKTFDYPLKML